MDRAVRECINLAGSVGLAGMGKVTALGAGMNEARTCASDSMREAVCEPETAGSRGRAASF